MAKAKADTKADLLEAADGFLTAEVLVEERGMGATFPVIQWVNGQPSNKAAGGIAYTGGFFISNDQGIEPPPGFEPYTYMTSDGAEVEGFSKADLNFSPIRYRRAWSSTPEDGGFSQRFAWDDYETASAHGQVRGSAHILIGVDGVDEPLMLVFSGMTAKGIMGMGRERGIVPRFSAKIVGAAKRLARKVGRKKAYPMCAFKLTIAGSQDSKGEPVFTTVGQGTKTSKITLPMWLDEPTALVDKAILNRLFVGPENFGTYQDYHQDAEEWVEAWSAKSLSRGDEASSAPTAAGGLPADQDTPF